MHTIINDYCLVVVFLNKLLTFSSSFPTEQEPGTEFIDMSVIDGGLNYILGKQATTGAFPVSGPVHNYELLVRHHHNTYNASSHLTEAMLTLAACSLIYILGTLKQALLSYLCCVDICQKECNILFSTEREEPCGPHSIYCCGIEGICGHIWRGI